MNGRMRIGWILVLSLSAAAWAGGKSFGLGVMLGDPTGLSAKLWTSTSTALDFGVGWSGYGRGRYGYWDPACENLAYYRKNVGYCDDQIIDGRRGFGPYDDYGWRVFHLHADYLFHNFDVIRSTERFPLYYGPGLNINYWDYDFLQMGVRGVLGIAWMPRTAPMDLFIELVPVLEIYPTTDVDVSGGIGGRFYF